MKKNNIIILSVLAVVVIITLIVAVVYFVNKANKNETEMVEVIEMMNFEKEQVAQEFESLTTEFDGYQITIKNDSLFKLLDNQKAKVQQLLEELRITKATDARKIAALRKELATVRAVMIRFVNQIDSLNVENKVLKTENKEVRRKYNEASESVVQLSKDKENLHEVVTRAAKLDVTNFSMETLNSRNKKTTWFSQVATLKFNYSISKNITAEPGRKTVYLRLTRPDNEVLTTNTSNQFQFENKNITYSAKKDFDYAGESLSDVIYWKVDEIVQKGDYRADFFIDDNRVGSFTFEVKK